MKMLTAVDEGGKAGQHGRPKNGYSHGDDDDAGYGDDLHTLDDDDSVTTATMLLVIEVDKAKHVHFASTVMTAK